jgi:CheY-like chemotaxis protein
MSQFASTPECVVDSSSPVILMADDDEEDRMMTREAFAETRFQNNFYTVKDGEELMDYLYRRNEYADPKDAPTPGLILLDLNMPKKDGREALNEIKGNPLFRSIPVVILTTSNTDEDILRTYTIGVNSFVTKPAAFGELVELARDLTKYWFEVVQLPVPGDQRQ